MSLKIDVTIDKTNPNWLQQVQKFKELLTMDESSFILDNLRARKENFGDIERYAITDDGVGGRRIVVQSTKQFLVHTSKL